METLGNQIQQNSAFKFYCSKCHYGTVRKCNYTTHLNSTRHIKNSAKGNNGNQIQQIQQFEQENSNNNYICENCNKEYYNKSGLWKHKKKCISNNSQETLISYLMNENKELKNMVIEVCKQIQPHNTNNNNNTINSHNKAFNLQFFLNETCKNAMNIKDFVDSVELELSDLENVGKNGYIQGISNIIIKNLNALEVEKRPIHCTDNKREIIYIKDEDKWEKEEENKPKLRKLIREISHKNICMFKKYREKYPDCDNYDSKKNDAFNKIVYESMGGKGDDETVKEKKIINNISKQIIIEKS
jgi:hypothetical protein